jgi:hypothetical protein
MNQQSRHGHSMSPFFNVLIFWFLFAPGVHPIDAARHTGYARSMSLSDTTIADGSADGAGEMVYARMPGTAASQNHSVRIDSADGAATVRGCSGTLCDGARPHLNEHGSHHKIEGTSTFGSCYVGAA